MAYSWRMTWDVTLAVFAFALVSSITPGPNNLMLLASGVNHGLRRTVPHVAGVSLGVALMVLALGAGVAELYARHPASAVALKVASTLYMLWLAWKIATAAAPDPAASGRAGSAGRPLTMLQAMGFQWVNPKAWAMALTAIGVYASGEGYAGVLLIGAAFLVVGPPSNVLWVMMGQGLRRLLEDTRARRRFNVAMAALLVASLWPILRA
jgi:threonine/homoserine/homoserine lactone efflux protein